MTEIFLPTTQKKSVLLMTTRFNFNTENPIIRDETVFSKNYLPEIIHQRGVVIEQITKNLVKQPVNQVRPTILAGPAGSGKNGTEIKSTILRRITNNVECDRLFVGKPAPFWKITC